MTAASEQPNHPMPKDDQIKLLRVALERLLREIDFQRPVQQSIDMKHAIVQGHDALAATSQPACDLARCEITEADEGPEAIYVKWLSDGGKETVYDLVMRVFKAGQVAGYSHPRSILSNTDKDLNMPVGDNPRTPTVREYSKPEWQPIETAPKGDWVLAIKKHPDGESPTEVIWAGCLAPFECGHQYTHWMPIPKPPINDIEDEVSNASTK